MGWGKEVKERDNNEARGKTPERRMTNAGKNTISILGVVHAEVAPLHRLH